MRRACHYNYIVEFGLNSLYRLFRIGDDGKQKVVAEIPVDRPAYMHSFGMTERSPRPRRVPPGRERARAEILRQALHPELSLAARARAEVPLVEKDSGKPVRTATRATPCFAFHHVNAFETAIGLAIDVIAYPDATIIDQLYLARLRCRRADHRDRHADALSCAASMATCRSRATSSRPFRSSCRASTTSATPASPIAMSGAPASQTEGDFLDSIVKIDPRPARSPRWHERGPLSRRAGLRAGAAATAEDDGVLLSIVLDIEKDRSFLLVLDAASLTELARADSPPPHPLPLPRQLLSEHHGVSPA